MNYLVADFEKTARRDLEKGDIDGVLRSVTDVVVNVIRRDSSNARVFSSKYLDRICQEAGRYTRVSAPAKINDHAVILATSMSAIGGHSRVIQDVIAADPSAHMTVLLSNTLLNLEEWEIDKIVVPEKCVIELAPTGNFASTLEWMKSRLFDIAPTTTYIFQHHFDPVIPAAAQPELVGKLIYYHNCDHALALGVHLPHAVHVDFNGKGFHNCREHEALTNNVVWPLTADVPESSVRTFPSHGRLTTACCGGYEKFELPHLIGALPYAITYPEIVARTLRLTGGKHYHIGELSRPMLTNIERSLKEIGAEKDQFIHVPFVENLAAALNELHVDIYMGSAPRGGGRATVEAMGAGMPLLIHSNYRTVFLSDENELYPDAPVWRNLDQLGAALREYTPQKLEDHSRRAREHYLAHHRPEHFREAVRRTLAGEAPAPTPPRPRHTPDALQLFWDEQSVVAEKAGEGRLQSGSAAAASRGEPAAGELARSVETVRRKADLSGLEGLNGPKILVLTYGYMASGRLEPYREKIAQLLAAGGCRVLTIKTNSFFFDYSHEPLSVDSLDDVVSAIRDFDPDGVICVNRAGLHDDVRNCLRSDVRIVTWFQDPYTYATPELLTFSEDELLWFIYPNPEAFKTKLKPFALRYGAKEANIFNVPFCLDNITFHDRKLQRVHDVAYVGSSFGTDFAELLICFKRNPRVRKALLEAYEAQIQEPHLDVPGFLLARGVDFTQGDLGPGGSTNFVEAIRLGRLNLQGIFDDQINMERRIHHLAKLAEFKLIFYGQIDEMWVPQMSIVEPKLLKAYQFEPISEPEDLAELYCKSRIGFNISRIAAAGVGFSFRVPEVMACGTVLVTESFSQPSLTAQGFEEGVDYVSYENPDDLRRKCEALLRSTDQTEAIAASAGEKLNAIARTTRLTNVLADSLRSAGHEDVADRLAALSPATVTSAAYDRVVFYGDFKGAMPFGLVTDLSMGGETALSG